MVEELLDNSKFISISKPLANQLKLLAGRLGVSVSALSTEAIEQLLRANEMNSTIKEAVDILYMSQIHQNAGVINFQRAEVKELFKKLFAEDPENLLETWHRSGKWYAAYLSNIIKGDFFNYLQEDLRTSWNLDESHILVKDVLAIVRLTSFGMSYEFTELLVMYTKGLFEELGYSLSSQDILPGLIYLEFFEKMA